MAQRPFRTQNSIHSERLTRQRIEPLLERHGFLVNGRDWVEQGTAITQIIDVVDGGGTPLRIQVRLCWRRDGRNARENLYSAAQLRARLNARGWHDTLASIADRQRRKGITHLLLVQDSQDGFAFAALLPIGEVPAIWERQREVSDDLIRRGLAGNLKKNHAENGSSPTLWLQDERYEYTPEVARVLWEWPGVINVLAITRFDVLDVDCDTVDDLPQTDLGRDQGARILHVRSGYPRNPKIRAAVRDRANGCCEMDGCGEQRSYPGFLDVHHILGIDASDRVWTCVALCPNCHREAHYSQDRAAINEALRAFAAQFKP